MATERKKILLRLDPAVHDALARWAGDELRSTNAQIEFLLRQALVNLLDNALDFAPRGSTVEARALGDRGRIGFEVADRGPGVPDYARDHVFERFYSLPRPGGGSRSSGLGLPFVAQVAQLHGGSIALRDRKGGGTVATIDLPAA